MDIQAQPDYCGDVFHQGGTIEYIRAHGHEYDFIHASPPCVALPKGGKVRDVPVPKVVAAALRDHFKEFEPIAVTLPWRTPDGPLVTKQLIFSGIEGNHVRVSVFNDHRWKPALAAAGTIPEAEADARHAWAREHGVHALRHFYAFVLLHAGDSIRALSSQLGHSDPGFTLQTYTHLMPSNKGHTRSAIDGAFRPTQDDQ
ncbi:tyrosine-type recombinase/integrase [Streptomyces chartreusis]|uniref:tyrosine-type recombinase/integrase n=1 Tax=Streptomyces chartreusis TaxID=1969 RepID=UPI0033FA5CEB